MIVALLAAACSVGGSGQMTTPDQDCTPGAYERLTQAETCVHKVRPPVVSLRRRIKAAYGIVDPRWVGELDHRVPFFLGGTTDVNNLWPEAGKIPNPKDKLEAYVYRRVCRGEPVGMTLTTARRIFLGDWRVAYVRYVVAR